jgi:hypothetical protein
MERERDTHTERGSDRQTDRGRQTANRETDRKRQIQTTDEERQGER